MTPLHYLFLEMVQSHLVMIRLTLKVMMHQRKNLKKNLKRNLKNNQKRNQMMTTKIRKRRIKIRKRKIKTKMASVITIIIMIAKNKNSQIPLLLPLLFFLRGFVPPCPHRVFFCTYLL